MSQNESAASEIVLRRGTLIDYLRIARIDHTTKHVFIIPGVVLAYLLRGIGPQWRMTTILLGLVTAVCIASANYVINEWLDRDYDRHHPSKSARTAVNVGLDGRFVLIEWAILVGLGLVCAWAVSLSMLWIAIAFSLQGIVYNVPPIRSKDRVYVDVISESINNSLRLMIGWTMIDPQTLPPSSIIFAFWSGGAFLMAAKRLSEYREITASHGKELLVRYRASFAYYSESKLTVSCLVYALLSAFFLAVFLIKYRIEYLIAVPDIIALFAQYLALSMQPRSVAQNPENLFQERQLMITVVILVVLCAIGTFVDIPILDVLTGQRFIGIG